MNKGYIHVYTGNGKGKSTAAFGLALRAMMSGRRIFIGQFVKSMKYNETRIEQYFPDQIHIEQLGSGCFIQRDPAEKDIALAQEGLRRCSEFILQPACGKDSPAPYDVVILDEISIALYYKMIRTEQVLEILEHRRPEIEIVLTGRYMPQELIDKADLVTEMKEIKHYYQQGVLSRDGIDR